MLKEDKSRLFHSFFFPITFVILLWLIKICEIVFQINLATFGVFPRSIKGIPGIFLAQLIHGDFNHLFSNSIPLIILGTSLFYYFKSLGYKVFFVIYLASGFWVWISARAVYHIGASGVVYGLAMFLFASGFIRNNIYLLAYSMFVAFFYGGLVWGLLPLENGISWESHLMGAIAGLMAAWHYKNVGIQREKYSWEINPSSDDDVDFDWRSDAQKLEQDVADEIEEIATEQSTISGIKYIYSIAPKIDANIERKN